MIVIKIEMWPGGRGGEHVREIGRMVIANQGREHGSTNTRGNYVAQLMRRGTQDKVQKQRELVAEPENARELDALFEAVGGAGEVHDYSRNAYPVWTLVFRALRVLGVPGCV